MQFWERESCALSSQNSSRWKEQRLAGTFRRTRSLPGNTSINCFVRSSWFCFKWGLVLALVIGLGVMLYLDRRLDEEIRNRVETLIAQGYPELDVAVRTAHFIEGEGISIRGLRIQDPEVDGPEAVLVDIDEVFLHSESGLQDLLQDSLRIEAFVITRPRIRAECDANGAWNLARLLPLPKLGNHPPFGGQLQNGLIEIVDTSKSPTSTLTLRDIHVTFQPLADLEKKPGSRTTVEYGTADFASQVSNETDVANSGVAAQNKSEDNKTAGTGMHFSGSLRGDRIHELKIVGDLFPGGHWRLAGEIDEIEVSPELHESLPSAVCPNSGPWGMLRAYASGTFAVEHVASRPEPWAYHADFSVKRGRVDDVQLPYPLTDLHAELRIHNGDLQISSGGARSRNTIFSLNGTGSLKQSLQAARIDVTARRLTFDQSLYASLPPKLQETWNKFLPAGEADIQTDIVFDGAEWRPVWVRADTSDLSFAYHKFPYRIQRAAGWLEMRELEGRRQRVSLGIRGHAEGVPVNIQADIVDPGPEYLGWMQVEGSHLKLSETMIAALPGNAPEVIRSLDPAGVFNVWMRFERQRPGDPQTRQMRLDVLDGAMRYVKFPYPILNVSGHVSLENDSWRFENFHGTNGGAHVHANATLEPTPLGNEFVLNINADNAALDEDLRSALPPATQLAWTDLRPRGEVDMNCKLKYLANQRALDLQIDVWPRQASCSLEPRQFPYRWENIGGKIVYNNGRIEFRRLRAKHGETNLQATGVFEGRGGEFLLRFDELAVDHVTADRDLRLALPVALRQAAIEISPEGPINLAGFLEFHRAAHPSAPMTARWNLDLFMHGNSIQVGKPLENIFGRVGLQGNYDGSKFVADGELELDSARLMDFQYNQIRGPIHIENSAVTLGDPGVFSGVGGSRGLDPRTHRHITAEFYGGRFLGDIIVSRGEQTEFTLRTQVDNADLSRFARDGLITGGEYKGRVFAWLNLRGAGVHARSLFGDGSVQLRDADIYELPLLVALLKVASLQTPDASAFTASNIDYRISGDRVYFNRLDFNGDAVSLIGRGEMDFDLNVNLSFGSMVGRSDRRIPILGDVLGEATKQFVKLNVTGPIADPQVTTETFPGVVKTLQQIQAELERSAAPPPRVPPVGTSPRRGRY